MTREVGDPVQVGEVGSATFTVGITDRSNVGRIVATGTVFVTLPYDALQDEQSIRSAAQSLAIQMVDADPSLLTPEGVIGNGGHQAPALLTDGKTPWSAGNSKHRVDKGAGNSKAILSPDSPEVDI